MGESVSKNQRTLDNPQPFVERPGMLDTITLPNGGLYHSLEDMDRLDNDPELKNKSIEFLANYADYVTRGSYNESWFKEDILKLCSAPYDRNNISSIGNVAFICLNSDNPTIKELTSKWLEKWRKTK